MKILPLSQGMNAVVDDDDFLRFGCFKWSASRRKHTYYAMRNGHRKEGRYMKRIYLHREIMGNPKNKLVDHKDQNGLNCAKNNLRLCSRSQNAMNTRSISSANKSGHRGVYWSRAAGKWAVQINIHKKPTYLGLFSRLTDAVERYRSANKKYFGSFGGNF